MDNKDEKLLEFKINSKEILSLNPSKDGTLTLKVKPVEGLKLDRKMVVALINGLAIHLAYNEES